METDSDYDSNSDSSPNTQRWNHIKQQLDNTVVSTKEELRNKLKQKLLLENTRRLSRYGQNNKLEQMKNQFQEKLKENNEVENKSNNETSTLLNKTQKKNAKRRQARKNKKNVCENTNENE
jgi:hypothetical protein